MVTEKIAIGPAVSSDLIRLAVAYNDALDRCTRTQGSNIDEVIEFFADDAMRVTVGQEPARFYARSTTGSKQRPGKDLELLAMAAHPSPWGGHS